MKARLLEILDSIEDIAYYTARDGTIVKLAQEATALVEQMEDD